MEEILAQHLTETAQVLEDQAKNLRARAENIRAKAARGETWNARKNQLETLGETLAKKCSYDRKAVQKAAPAFARAHALPAETAEFYALAAVTAEARAERARRDREILRRARLGHTNAEIAAELKISPRTVTRAITAAYRRKT